MILVTGATGFVGRHLVARLVEERLPVRVLIPARAQRRLPWQDVTTLDLFEGSIFEPEPLYRAMAGVHTVIHLASAQWWGRLNDLEHVDVGGTQNVITAARSARIGRMIVLSQIGAEPAAGFHLLRVKGQMEQLVRKSGIAYTIFRSGVIFGPDDHFVNNIAMTLRSNPFFVLQPGAGETLLHPLHIDDLTEALFNSLETINLVDETVEIGGAEYMTFNEMIRTVMRVTNCQRSIIALPPYMLRGLASFFRLIPLRWTITPQWFDILASNRTAMIGNMYNYLGVRPRRFEDTILTYMPSRRYSLELIRYLFRRRRSAF
jgi:NADH dehydrogenase